VWLNDVMPQWLASSQPKHFVVIDEGRRDQARGSAAASRPVIQ
jgi:hypothetical protein